MFGVGKAHGVTKGIGRARLSSLHVLHTCAARAIRVFERARFSSGCGRRCGAVQASSHDVALKQLQSQLAAAEQRAMQRADLTRTRTNLAYVSLPIT